MAFYFESGQPPILQIPLALADSYLSLATGAQIKVMLCLIRFEGMPLTEEAIARHCHLDKSDVQDAIKYWVEQKMLTRRGSTLCLHATERIQQTELPQYTADEIMDKTESDDSFKQLVEAAQGVLGKIFNRNDLNILCGIYDNLGFGNDIIMQLLGFCAGNGKKNFRYIEKVAIDWHDRGIDTFEKADAYICHLEEIAKDEHRIAVMFGIDGRALSKKEKEYIAQWREQMNLHTELIEEAYNICVDKKGKLSFAYINGILADWHKKGYKTVEDVENAPRMTETDEVSDFEKAAFAKLHEEV